MARTPRRGVLGSALAVVSCLLVACTVGPSERPPVAVRGQYHAPPTAPTERTPGALPVPDGQRPTIGFTDCTADTLAELRAPLPAGAALRVECGELITPADPGRLDAGAAALTVLRVGPATDSPGAIADRPPLLLLGDTGGEPTARHAVLQAARLDPAVLKAYSVIGLDRRGVGLDLLDCSPHDSRAALLDAEPPAPTDDAALTALLEDARSVVQECTIDLDGMLGTFSSAATAGDIGRLRSALGVQRLSAVGVGDGAAALARWVTDEPDQAGRVVLDGPPHPRLDEPDRTEATTAATASAFTAFATRCTAGGDCPLGPDPQATTVALLGRLRTQPLPAADGGRLTAGAAVAATRLALGDPDRWPELAAALAAANAGDPAALLAVLAPVTGPRGTFDAHLATSCNDTRVRLAPAEAADLARRWQERYPVFGGYAAVGLLACAPWPTGGPAAAPGSADGAPPVLVIGGAADPRASQDGARQAAEALPSGTFLAWQGAGTGAYPRTPCVRAVVDAMLVTGEVPATGQVCPP